LGIDAEEIAWRKQYTQFSEDDAVLLEEMGDIFEEIGSTATRSHSDYCESLPLLARHVSFTRRDTAISVTQPRK
jgi:hypothetical protein